MASPLVSAPPFAGMGKPRRDVKGDAPDGDRPTIHLRCGSDIRQTLREGGFVGGFVEYADPVCQGPV
ncbi:MAG: hypothetical protein WCZ23_14500, partial [Rhodospirillaceae bacterium]